MCPGWLKSLRLKMLDRGDKGSKNDNGTDAWDEVDTTVKTPNIALLGPQMRPVIQTRMPVSIDRPIQCGRYCRTRVNWEPANDVFASAEGTWSR